MSKIYGTATDLLWTTRDRFVDEKMAQRIGLMTVFLINKPFSCQSIADPVRSGNVFYRYLLPRKHQG